MKTLHLPYLSSAIFIIVFTILSNKAVSQNVITNSGETRATVVRDGKSFVQLDWNSNLQGISHFTVERSVDGQHFSNAGIVFTSDDPEFSNYKFRDRDLATQTSAIYYRISMVTPSLTQTIISVTKVELTYPAATAAGRNAGHRDIARF